MENNNKIINYQNTTYQDIKDVINIQKKLNHSKFNNWFNFKYKISDTENTLLQELIIENELYLSKYNEAKLFAKFISPILHKVNFQVGEIKDWYESFLQGEVNGFKFNGKTDFMVAKGDVSPDKPYFFIQEYKQTLPNNDPEYQLLAEMLVAMEINKTNILHGGFIIGKFWDFVILEKLKNGNYEYFVSKSFNSLDIKELQQIYINLQAAKVLFCKE